jgi:phage terminase Nu1 subunit (DNA packaging protein)
MQTNEQATLFPGQKTARRFASPEEMAAHLDIGVAQLTKLVRSNIIPRFSTGMYDMDECRLGYIRHMRAVAARHKGGEGAPELTAERARLAKLQSDKIQIEIDTLQGRLIPAELVEKEWTNLVARFRARIIAIPSKLAHQVAVMQSVPEIEELIRALAYEALNELAEDTNAPSDNADLPQDA